VVLWFVSNVDLFVNNTKDALQIVVIVYDSNVTN